MKIQCLWCEYSYKIDKDVNLRVGSEVICPKCGKNILILRSPRVNTSINAFTNFFIIVILICIGTFIFFHNGHNSTPVSSSSSYESDLIERCKDWLYYRNRAYKLGREGDQKGAAEASAKMNRYYDDMRKLFSESEISSTIGRLESSTK